MNINKHAFSVVILASSFAQLMWTSDWEQNSRVRLVFGQSERLIQKVKSPIVLLVVKATMTWAGMVHHTLCDSDMIKHSIHRWAIDAILVFSVTQCVQCHKDWLMMMKLSSLVFSVTLKN